MKKQYTAKRFRALLTAVLLLSLLMNLFAIMAQDTDAENENEEDILESVWIDGELAVEDDSVFSINSITDEEEPEEIPEETEEPVEPETIEPETAEPEEEFEIEEPEEEAMTEPATDEEEPEDIAEETEEPVEQEATEPQQETTEPEEEFETEEPEEEAMTEPATDEEEPEDIPEESEEPMEQEATEPQQETSEEEDPEHIIAEPDFDAWPEIGPGIIMNIPGFVGNSGFTWNGDDYDYEDTIDLSLASPYPNLSYTGPGYTVSGTTPPFTVNPTIPALAHNTNNVLDFDSGAHGKAYHIIQTGVYKPLSGNPPPPETPHRYSCIFKQIHIPDGVEVTLVISGIDMEIGVIVLTGTGKLNLLLDGTNFVREHIEVPSLAEITIDSLSGNDAEGILAIPSEVQNSRSPNAAIGGGAISNSGGMAGGTINIMGGTINITSRSSGACIGGGGTTNFYSESPAYPGGDGGTINIAGGVLNLTQIGPGSELGTGYGGACIGGGGGNATNGGDGGTINITGGTLTIRQHTRGAGIGGGTFGPAGHIMISGGNIDAEVIRLTDLAGEGAAIGSASGSNRTGTGSILITGGTIRAVSYTTGIGRAHGMAGPSLSITITGGNIYAKGNMGPGIGFFNHSYNDPINITGGTIIAMSDTNAGIGSADANNVAIGAVKDNATLHLDAAANVKAYSGGNIPAINAADNQGDGYFVNACLDLVISALANTPLHVYAENGGAFLKTLELPANYRHFAYSSDITSSRTDNIFAEIGSDFKSVLRVADDSPQIYSIVARSGYNTYNQNANSGSLPVHIDTDSHYLITEKYVDISGKPLASDTTASVSHSNPVYSKTIPPINGYKVLGYSIGGNYTGTYTPGATATIDPVSQNMIVYFVYREYIFTTLTISKTVTGAYANKTKEFTFTLSFKDSAGNPLAGRAFDFIGDPGSGTLTLNANGEAEIRLKHGQSITIDGIAEDYKIQIEEASDINYNVTYIDSVIGTGEGCDTGEFAMGENPRSIDFTNDRKYVPETGISIGSIGAMLLLPALAALAILGWFAAKAILRRKTGTKPASC